LGVTTGGIIALYVESQQKHSLCAPDVGFDYAIEEASDKAFWHNTLDLHDVPERYMYIFLSSAIK